MHNPNLKILECTLRDGSYAIDFQFTAKDTAVILAALEHAGFDLIELGHGVGLHASQAGKGQAAASDEEYLKAAASTLKCAQWGMFFIPGIARHEDLDLAAQYGMHFVRIGTNVTEVEQAEAYANHAKRLGMYTSINLMKSYVLSPGKLVEKARLAEKFGADIVCLVDSAGTMLPENVRHYLEEMHAVLNIPTGLHCHDNLALGMANVLMAIECGVERIDTTMQGMGRGGGNPATEILVSVLKKKGIDLGINLNRLMDVSEKLIKPLLHDKGCDPINITSGYAGFHSSYLQIIMRYAQQYHVDPRDIIVQLCALDQVYAPEELVEELARKIQALGKGRSGMHIVALPQVAFGARSVDESPSVESLAESARRVACEVRTEAIKRGRKSVFNIVAAAYQEVKATVSRFVQEEFDFIIGSVEVDNPAQLKEIILAVDGLVDILLVDADVKPYLREPLVNIARQLAAKSTVLGYSDSSVWVQSVNRQMIAIMDGVNARRIVIFGSDKLSLKLAFILIEQGAGVILTGLSEEHGVLYTQAVQTALNISGGIRVEPECAIAMREASAVVAFDRYAPLSDCSLINVLPQEAVLFDAGIGAMASEVIMAANVRGIRVIRPDMRAVLAGELKSILGVDHIVKDLMGRKTFAGVSCVAGGLIGRTGEIVVDSITSPSRVVGVADGSGKVIYDRLANHQAALIKVEEVILKWQAFLGSGSEDDQ